jgi:hypothetical protein
MNIAPSFIDGGIAGYGQAPRAIAIASNEKAFLHQIERASEQRRRR